MPAKSGARLKVKLGRKFRRPVEDPDSSSGNEPLDIALSETSSSDDESRGPASAREAKGRKRAVGRPRQDPVLKTLRNRQTRKDYCDVIEMSAEIMTSLVPGAFLCGDRSAVLEMTAQYVLFLQEAMRKRQTIIVPYYIPS